jgi:hypothetical protein
METNCASDTFQLNFYHKLDAYLVKYSIQSDSISYSFKRKVAETFPAESPFLFLASQSLSSVNYSNTLDLFVSPQAQTTASFYFHVIASKSSSRPSLDANLSNFLFACNNFDILLIAVPNGCLHWCAIEDNSKKRVNELATLDERVLLSTTSSIVFIGSFRCSENDLNPFLKANTTTAAAADIDNCLFFVTKCGKIYLFSYLQEFVHKICILAHKIVTCLKYTQTGRHFLVYSTHTGQIFFLELVNCLRTSTVKSTFVRKFANVKQILKGKRREHTLN